MSGIKGTLTPTRTTAACHCGAVEIQLSKAPSEIFECNCTICRKLGVLWAYYHCDDVAFEKGQDSTKAYVWNRKTLEFHTCRNCGCTTHWVAVDSSFREKMGVNARLIDGLDRTNTRLAHVDYGGTNQFWTRDSDA